MRFSGYQLKERRTEMELSCEEVSLRCSIPYEVVIAFEEADIDNLPAECFAIGFLRSYCRFLGLEDDTFIHDFRESIKELTGVGAPKRPRKKRRTNGSPSMGFASYFKALPQEIQAWLAVCGILLLGWVSYSVVFGQSAESNVAQVQAASVELRLPDAK